MPFRWYIAVGVTESGWSVESRVELRRLKSVLLHSGKQKQGVV